MTRHFALILIAASACNMGVGSPEELDGTSRSSSALAGAATENTDPPKTLPASERTAVESWRAALDQKQILSEGCFHAAYPDATWHEVPCGTVPPYPQIPAKGPGTGVVGNGTDFVASRSSLSKVSASFLNTTGVTSEHDSLGAADSFSLQLNSNLINNADTQALCRGGTTPAQCRGWQQFMLQNTLGDVFHTFLFIQYWLVGYGATALRPCPAGWFPFGTDCFINSSSVTPFPNFSAAYAMSHLTLTGYYQNGLDVVSLSGGHLGQSYLVSVPSRYHLNGTDWTTAEFNIFGWCCGTQAVFNRGVNTTVQLVTYFSFFYIPVPASCVGPGGAGLTAETNNMTLGTCTGSPSFPFGINFTESSL